MPPTLSSAPPAMVVSHAPKELIPSPHRPHEPSAKSPLSESTVIVEKSDVEDREKTFEGYDTTPASRTDFTLMEVDS